MTPKFEVGEVVILQSKYRPECNGEAEVLMVDEAECIRTGEKGTAYLLNIAHPKGLYWSESALRKKHLPGSISFRDLMQTLKDPSYA